MLQGTRLVAEGAHGILVQHDLLSILDALEPRQRIIRLARRHSDARKGSGGNCDPLDGRKALRNWGADGHGCEEALWRSQSAARGAAHS